MGDSTQISTKKQDQRSPLKSFLAGGFGGGCLVLVGHPLDLIKVRIQTTNLYKGVIDCARQTIARDGFFGLYRGMSAPLTGVVPIFAVSFWGNEVGQRLARIPYNQSANENLSLAQVLFAGGFSAIPTTLIMAPGERIKVLLQLQGTQSSTQGTPPKYKGMIDCATQLYKEGGIRSIFKGSAATLLRDVPGSAAYFGAYTIIKQNFMSNIGTPQNWKDVLTISFAGGMAGIFNWVVCLPADVVKNIWQGAPEGKYKNMYQVFREVIQNDGVKGLYKGLGPALLRAFPANAVCFVGMEFALRFLNILW